MLRFIPDLDSLLAPLVPYSVEYGDDTGGVYLFMIKENLGLYSRWLSMLDRCRNPRNSSYKNYGSKGIKVCDRWMTFENFKNDMGRCPKSFSIERLNVDGDYCPENCIWADAKTQSRNKRHMRKFRVDGKEMLLIDIMRATGMTYNRTFNRLNFLVFMNVTVTIKSLMLSRKGVLQLK